MSSIPIIIHQQLGVFHNCVQKSWLVMMVPLVALWFIVKNTMKLSRLSFLLSLSLSFILCWSIQMFGPTPIQYNTLHLLSVWIFVGFGPFHSCSPGSWSYFTDNVRSTRKGNVFSHVCLFTRSVPIPWCTGTCRKEPSPHLSDQKNQVGRRSLPGKTSKGRTGQEGGPTPASSISLPSPSFPWPEE